MDDQEGYNQGEQYNDEESYGSDIQKKFERELNNMERTRQQQNQDQQGDEDQGEENEDQQEFNQEDQNQGEYEDNQDEQEQHQEEGEYQDQEDDQNQMGQQNEEDNEVVDYQEQNGYNQENEEQEEVEGGDEGEGEKEEISHKVEQIKNEDGSITTVNYTTVTKTRTVEQYENLMPTIQDQNIKSTTKQVKSTHVSEEGNALVMNNNQLIQLVTTQKMTIQTLKEDLKDEKEINIIQALEIESLKKLVRQLQGNLDSLSKQQTKAAQNPSSPQKTEYSRRSVPIFDDQDLENENPKRNQSQLSGSKQYSQKNSEFDETLGRRLQGSTENLYLSNFQKGLWLPEKEKFANRQLYGQQQQSDQKQKTLKPLKKITPKDKKSKKEVHAASDVNISLNKEQSKIAFEEELDKIAKLNKDQFAKIYKQNKIIMQKDMFQDYQKRKQAMIEQRENKIKDDINWQDTLHPVSRTKSVKNMSVNLLDSYEKNHRMDLRTPGYMERQLIALKTGLQQNSQSITHIPTQENGYSPNSISSIAAGNTYLKQMQVQSSVQIPNLSQSPLQSSKPAQTNRKIFLYQVTDTEKNSLQKPAKQKLTKITQDDLLKYEHNLEMFKEKTKEEERKKLEEYDKLKVSSGYRLMRKNSEEIRKSAVMSASSSQKESQVRPQFRVPYPTLSTGMLSSSNPYTTGIDKITTVDKISALSTLLAKGSERHQNPYSLSANPQKDNSPPTPKRQIKINQSIITTTNVSQSVSNPAGKNPYVLPESLRQSNKQETNNNIGQGQQTSKKDNHNPNGQVSTSQTHKTTVTTYAQANNTNKNNNRVQDNQDYKNQIGNKGQKQEANNRYDNQGLQNQYANSNKNQQNNNLQSNKQGGVGQPNNLNNSKKGSINWDDQENPSKILSKNQQNNDNQSNQNKLQGQGQQNQQSNQTDTASKNLQNYQGQNQYFQNKYGNKQQPSNNNQQGGEVKGKQDNGNSQGQQQNQQGQNQLQNKNKQGGDKGDQNGLGFNQQQNQQGHNQQYNKNQQGGDKRQDQQGNNLSSNQKQNQQGNNQQSNKNQQGGRGQGQQSPSQNNNSNNNPNSNMDTSRVSDNINKSQSSSQGSKNQQQSQGQGSNRSGNSNSSKYPDKTDFAVDDSNTHGGVKGKIISQSQNNKGAKNEYDHDNSSHGIGDMSDVKANFTKFQHQGQQIKENQQMQQPKRVPKVREEIAPVKKSVFIEQLEKEAEQNHEIQVADEKVFLKPIESDDEPMFGYNGSDEELDENEEEEEQEEQHVQTKIQKRSSLKQDFNHKIEKKRVSIMKDQSMFSKDEDDDGDEQVFRKTPKTPFNQRNKIDENSYAEQSLQNNDDDYED